MKIKMLAAVSFALFTAFGALSAQDAKQILNKTAAAYKNLKTYQDNTNVRIDISANGLQQKIEVESVFSIKRPGKAACLVNSGTAGLTFVSNGKKLWMYLPATGKYSVKSAPGSIEELTRDALLGSQGNGPANFLKLFSADPLAALMSDAKEAVFVGEKTSNGKKVYDILLKQRLGDVNLWIDTKTYMVLRISADMTKAIEEERKKIPGVPEMEVTYTETHDNVRLNKSIDDASFEFVPPADAAEVEDLVKDGLGRQKEEESPLKGEIAMDFTLDGLKDGESFTLSQYRGKVVMLDFFATWCPPCRKELPLLQKLNEKYKDKDFIFIAVDSMEEKRVVENFAASQKLDFNIALDTDGSVGNKFRVDSYPTLVIIDKFGNISGVHVGYDPEIESRVGKEIDELLAK